MNGKFVISLDYELHWGIFDVLSEEQYFENLVNTENAVDEMLKVSNEFEVRLTFATVGILFANDKNELQQYLPKNQPTYTNKIRNPYLFLDTVGATKKEAPFHFAKKSIEKIKADSRHEIGTHTFSHYYCLEDGQTAQQFDADLKSAVAIAKSMDIDIKSIVFPRNQVKEEYLEVCVKNDITSYRGTETAGAYNPTISLPRMVKRGSRMLDSYFNLLGHHTISLSELSYKTNTCLNLPSSRFFRPYNAKLKLIQGLKLRRIKKSMTHAAKNKHLYHLWWHPHNFGKDLDQNISDLKKIYEHFQKLNKKYGFESETMSSVSSKIRLKNQ